LNEEKVREVLLGASEHRLRRKATALTRLTELHGADDALYQALATTLGYKSNKLPFTLLAQRLPLRLLQSRAGEGDALLFGVAGFLPAEDLAEFEADSRSYLRTLWEQWWPRRGEFERLTIPKPLWRFSGQRPVNHPQRRLAALGQMVRNWPKIRALRQRCDPEAITDFFSTLSQEFWDFHYTLSSKASARRMALIGETRVTEMLTNVFFPLAFAEDSSRWLGFKTLPATHYQSSSRDRRRSPVWCRTIRVLVTCCRARRFSRVFYRCTRTSVSRMPATARPADFPLKWRNGNRHVLSTTYDTRTRIGSRRRSHWRRHLG
jgi:hypothetical protein